MFHHKTTTLLTGRMREFPHGSKRIQRTGKNVEAKEYH
jgi:hypothetical protein